MKSIIDKVFLLRHELAWVVVGQILAFLGGFAGIKLLTNAMGTAEYGRLAIGMTVAGFLNMFVYGPIGQVISRYFSVYKERGELDIYFLVLKKAHITVGALLVIGTLVAGVVVRWWFGMDWALLVVTALLFGIIAGINTSFLALQSAIRQRKIVALHQAADTWARPILAIFGLWFLGTNAPSAFVGFIAGTLLVTLSQGIFALKCPQIQQHWHVDINKHIQWQPVSREYFSYASPFILFSGFAAISMYADRWVLQGLFGESEVGIYTALYQIGNAPVALLMGLISQFVIPIIFERAGAMKNKAQVENSSKLLYQMVVISIMFLIPIVMAAFFFAEPLVRILTNVAFSKSAEVLWIIVCGIAIFNVGQLLVVKGLNHNRPEIYIFPKILQACSFVLLAYYLAKEFRLMGVAVALCVSSVLYLSSVVFANRHLALQKYRFHH